MTQSLGNISWWGFSPTFDILPAIPSDATGEDPANVLLVGAGDARHVLTTIARSYRHSRRKVNFYVIESNLESVARQILFLRLAVEPLEVLGLQEKTETFLELFGNSLLRPQTRDYLTNFANETIKMVTNLDFMSEKLSLVDLSRLKFKERDFMEFILKFWRDTDVEKFPIHELWDGRNRQYLGTRYDFRRNAFDWDYNMKLLPKEATTINSKQYADWREKGIAFESRDGCYEFPNRTLSSGALVRVKGEKMAKRGYFGDIVTSPYIAYGIEAEDPELLKTRNGVHVSTAVTISSHAVTTMFYEIAHRTRYENKTVKEEKGDGDGPKITEITEEPTLDEIVQESIQTGLSMAESSQHSAIDVGDFKVIFLPLASTRDIAKKHEFQRSFNFAFFSNSLVHLLEPELKCLFAEKAELVVESSKFVLDLRKENHDQYAGKIISMADRAGFKQKTTFNAEKDAVARFDFVYEE